MYANVKLPISSKRHPASRPAANHQHRLGGIVHDAHYPAYHIAARDMIQAGLLGELCDMEVRIQVNTPWHLWQFLFSLPRVEILYHSIHYVDLVRSFCGTPKSIYAKTMSHPTAPDLRGGTCSLIIMNYGENPRVNIMTNHSHAYGPEKQQSSIKFEGSQGAIQIRAGLNMNYPEGLPDRFEYILLAEGDNPQWQSLEIAGSWFPEAFIGMMASLMRYANGETSALPTSVEDAIMTMAKVDASNQRLARLEGVILSREGLVDAITETNPTA